MRALALLLLLLLAGCTSTPPPVTVPPSVAGLHWPVMLAYTTHDEPEPQRGNLMLAWSGTTFAVSAPGESGMAVQAVVVSGIAYTTNLGLGWTRGTLEAGIPAQEVNNRNVLWDLKGLVNNPSLLQTAKAAGEWLNVTGSGSLHFGLYELEITFDVRSKEGTVVEAFVASPQGIESPYSFRPTSAPFPFDVAPPATSLTRPEVDQGDYTANNGHVAILALIDAYAKHHGNTLPETVSPQTLQVELVASGKPWPINPYSGSDVKDARASGEFLWHRCTLSDGRFTGYGNDAVLLQQSFGKSCG